MLEEYKYKTELHAHTKPGSICSEIPPEDMVRLYAEGGFSSVAITNHFIYDTENPEEKIEKYLADYHKAKELGDVAGLNVILGAELRFSENNNDYLIYGIEEDDLCRINSLLGSGIESFYKTFKNSENIIIQAHPFRNGNTPACPESVDGVEVFNLHPNHNSRIAVAAKYAREHNLLVTAGTDFHHPGHQMMCSVMTKDKITTSKQLAKVIKEKDYIIDISGYKVVI